MLFSAEQFKQKSPLIKKLRDIMATSHMAQSTVYAYVNVCADFFSWADCGTIDCLDGKMVERYLTYLAVERKVSESVLHQSEYALKFLLRCNIRPRKVRLQRNILTRSEIKEMFKTMPKKYREALSDPRSIGVSAESYGGHRNSIQYAFIKHSEKVTGLKMTVPGFKRSLILQEIIKSKNWQAAERKWGVNAVKTACAEFVRSFPKTIIDNLAC